MPKLKLDNDVQQVFQKIESRAEKNQQLSGHFKLRARGIKRLFGSIELDLIAKKPSYLYLSIHSFFKQPAQVITYDGQDVRGLQEKNLEQILNLPVSPPELVQILLNSFSLDLKKAYSLQILDNKIKVKYQSGYLLELWINLENFEIKKRLFKDPSGELVYSIDYTYFPKRFEFEVNHEGKKHAMTLSSEDAELNQGNFDEDLFRR